MSENKSPRQEARAFVGGGYLRDNIQGKLSDEALEKIIEACSFVLKV